MDTVKLMYLYRNKYINSDELLEELENLDFSNFSSNEIKQIHQIVCDIKKIKDTIPNEVDEYEKRRMKSIDRTIESLEKMKKKNNFDNVVKEKLKKYDKQLHQAKKQKREGGKLYETILKLLMENTIIKANLKKMSDEDLLAFITDYISVPNPLPITKEKFNTLAHIAMKQDDREALWRLAFNYNCQQMDMEIIENYFIEKRDHYYLAELVCACREDISVKRVIDKVLATQDDTFIQKAYQSAIKAGILDKDNINDLEHIDDDIKHDFNIYI